ncbi:MAG: hypothetical protein AAFQ94_00960 [Bacteroidota bacterium]
MRNGFNKENTSISKSNFVEEDILALCLLTKSADEPVTKRLLALQQENEKLRKMYTQLSIDYQTLKDTLHEGW